MIASIILIGALKLLNKPVEKAQWAGLIMIVLFGGLTIVLRDEQFIKLKPTVLYFVLALTLFFPQFFKKYLIKSLLEKQISLPEESMEKVKFFMDIIFCFFRLLKFLCRIKFFYRLLGRI